MTIALTGVLAALHLEYNHLFTLYEWIDHLANYLGTAYGGCTYLY